LAGRCFQRAALGRAAQGLADCERALAQLPGDPTILDSRAYALLRLGRWADARLDYDASIASETANAITLLGRAVARARPGDAAGAQADLAEARRRQTDIDARAATLGLAVPRLAEAPPPSAVVAPTGK